MIPVAFEYLRARDAEHALALLAQYGDEAKVLAGGHSLIPMMKLRLATPGVLVDLADVPEMHGMTRVAGGVRIGALTTHATLARDRRIAAEIPVLCDAANVLGDRQVRHRGTIGGACAHGDPAADYPAVMLALGGTFALRSQATTRVLGADAFFQGMFETALAPGELLLEIESASAPTSAYVKLPHPASGYAVVGVAVKLELRGEQIASARVALTSVGDCAYRALATEDALAGVYVADIAAIERACARVTDDVDVRADAYAPADYRRAVAATFAARAVMKAAARREGAR